MRIAVIGGTGLVGREVVRALEARGDEPVVVARSRGVDLLTGDGLDAALAGAEALIDVTNTFAATPDDARAFFATTTTRLQEAAQRAGARHHVVLSIVGVDRVDGNAHYAGKVEQERLALAGPVPATIVRATQFHEFGEQVARWTRDGDTATIPPLLVQPVAVPDLAAVLIQVAHDEGADRTLEVAGPETQDLVDMARRALARRGDTVRLAVRWGGAFPTTMAGEVLLPGPDARIAPTTFDDWLGS
jgi:uncharacterized protein YbjT (DUF2867 family)